MSVLCSSEEVVRQVRQEIGPKSILSFSRGKDSIGAYLAIRDHFEEIVPYHLYLVPGLSFVDESLDYYERHVFRRKIINLPHPSFFRWLNNYTFLPPGYAQVIRSAKLPNFSYLDVFSWVCRIEGLDPEKMLVASGVRAADSPLRRVAFSKHGAISYSQRQYYPVHDWNKARLLSQIDASGIPLPDDYLLFGRSFDGLDYRFLKPLKDQRPADYRRILEFFPLAEAEVHRYERAAA
jgi:hypothetical protein